MESEQGQSVRVLFAGACRGNFNKLLKKVEKVHDKNGPFDVLFCVGGFFSEGGDPNAPDGADIEFMQFLDSNKKMSMKTYILGAYGHGSALAKQGMDETDCNIHCLGRSGILEMPNGLTVAFLEGIYNPEYFDKEPTDSRYYTRREVNTLKQTIQNRGGEVDFFLSCEWPEGITKKLPEGSLEEFGELPKGSPHVSSLLGVTRPRYHITSQPPLFFSRAPYKNPDLGAGSHVTRFASLCPFSGVSKQNLFALCLTPARLMTVEQLCEIPPGSTESPFDSPDDRKRPVAPQVWVEASADDSSCTPQLLSQGEYEAHHRYMAVMRDTYARMMEEAGCQRGPEGVFDPAIHHPSPTAGDTLGAGIETLLRNIGRSNLLPGSLHNQNSLGTDSGLGGINPNPMQMQPDANGLTPLRPFSEMEVITYVLRANGLLDEFSNPYTVAPSVSESQFDIQELVDSIAQHPSVWNIAVSMGLGVNTSRGFMLYPYEECSDGISRTMPISPDQIPMQDIMASLATPNQAFPQSLQYMRQSDVDTETASESIVSDRRTPSAMDIDRHQAPSPHSKRYKQGSMDNGQFVRDRRKTCHVGNLPVKATQEDVAQYFSQAGHVVQVLKRQGEGNDTSWAFVQYASQSERDHAIQMLDQTLFEDQKLSVRRAKQDLEFDPNEPVKGCWFCLGSPSSDKGLIVSVGKESYLAVDKGPISDDHVLIIPTNHYPSTLKMPQSCYEEMQSYLIGLRDMFLSQGRSILAFERYLQIPRLHGNHTHLSVISIDASAALHARETFVQRGRMQEGEWSYLNPNEATREAVHDIVGDEEYIVVLLPDGSKLVRVMFKKTRLPVSFGRDVLAELAGIPERADWKLCVASKAEEKAKVERFKTQFSAFDYPNQS